MTEKRTILRAESPRVSALLRMVDRVSDIGPEDLFALRFALEALARAFERSELRGSVCIRGDDALFEVRRGAETAGLSKEEAEALFEKGRALMLRHRIAERRDKAEALEETRLGHALRAVVSGAEAGITKDGPDISALAAEKAVSFPVKDLWLEPSGVFVFDEEPGTGRIYRIYQTRFFSEELRLARALVRLAGVVRDPPSAGALEKLETLTRALGADDLQKAAIELALRKNLAVVSGGPGTGKTTSVVLMLECLLEQHPSLTFALTAPTGKAASRLQQSIVQSIQSRRLKPHLNRMRALFENPSAEPPSGRTIHKLLVTPLPSGERPGAGRPVRADVLIVDEASMMDIHLASRLFEALSPETRLIVLGDKHQLAAVGPGSVYADMSDAKGPLSRNVVELRTSRRFREGTVISRLAHAINHEGVAKDKAADLVASLLSEPSGETEDIAARWFDDLPDAATGLSGPACTWLLERSEPYLEALRQYCRAVREEEGEALEEAWKTLWASAESFRALASRRRGPQSVEALNAFLESRVREAMAGAGEIDERVDRINFPGRMLIIRHNDDKLGLFNGNIGIVVPRAGEARSTAIPDDDVPDAPPAREVRFGDTNPPRSLAPALLPENDTAFSLTIHQSQGSEFDHVAVFLPAEADSPLATRELLYTAVTRAKKSVTIFGSAEALRASVEGSTIRTGGLSVRIREAMRDVREGARAP